MLVDVRPGGGGHGGQGGRRQHHVGVDEGQPLRRGALGAGQAGPGLAQPPRRRVAVEADDRGAGRGRHVARAVGRAVVDHDHLGGLAGTAATHAAITAASSRAGITTRTSMAGAAGSGPRNRRAAHPMRASPAAETAVAGETLTYEVYLRPMDGDEHVRDWAALHRTEPPAGFVGGWLKAAAAVARPLARAGVSPNMVTVAALVMAVAAVPLAAIDGWIGPAAACLAVTLSGLLDSLDGAVAVQAGRATKVGFLLDSALDRIADAAFPAALAIAAGGSGAWLAVGADRRLLVAGVRPGPGLAGRRRPGKAAHHPRRASHPHHPDRRRPGAADAGHWPPCGPTWSSSADQRSCCSSTRSVVWVALSPPLPQKHREGDEGEAEQVVLHGDVPREADAAVLVRVVEDDRRRQLGQPAVDQDLEEQDDGPGDPERAASGRCRSSTTAARRRSRPSTAHDRRPRVLHQSRSRHPAHGFVG